MDWLWTPSLEQEAGQDGLQCYDFLHCYRSSRPRIHVLLQTRFSAQGLGQT